MADIDLLRFLYDLMKDPAVRQQFNQNSIKVMQSYALDANHVQAVHTMDPARVGAEVTQVLKNFQMDESEFPPDSENCLPEITVAQPQYPSPAPAIFRFQPPSVSKAKLPQSGNFELIVRGQSFAPSKTTIEVKEDKAGGVTLASSAVKTFGTYRCSGVLAAVTVPATAPTGNYVVTITVNPGTPYQVAIPATHRKLELTA